jgi:uncharacterized damage-inducible protein DinB
MKMTEWFLALLEEEAATSRRALERVPEGRQDWKPHEKSMPLGYLAAMVARMPAWCAMMINQDEYDIVVSTAYTPKPVGTSRELLQVLDDSLAEGREALARTSDEHLLKPWRLIVSGQVVSEQPRYETLRNGVFSHMAHHRGQLTVYLRLTGALVPALYGPTADERF